ncbi:hypothetical protein CIB93_25270 [Streptomyces sp. WZ.A104]|uniref:DUF6344 domain-containing protein n=1 Tax=Streptomyces durocortorensis TaxID=2811104 RepID=A0ABY9VZP1_9ACTN|nr:MULTISPECIES: DUF6344 domain-containing protein [Streptomyces]PCG83328.1 hypothetical protein CIB93_25270 [Streptomyces sp. WZ.A104]WNF28251.1 DUF6344 domain-containing protein [Streptomyces durocortorensis]
MSTFQPKNIWTAFVTAFFALLASLGLATAAASTANATNATNAAAQPSATTHEHTGATAATPLAPSVRWTLPRDRALPPTMKQRIRAEAHGSSPATRHLSPDAADTARTTGPADSHRTAPEGDSPVPPP